MIGILLIGVSICIYIIFKYDDWYPNPVISDQPHSTGERMAAEDQGLPVGAE